MKKKIIGLVVLVIILVGLGFLIVKNNKTINAPVNSKLEIVGTFYPLAHFAQQVGGNDINMVNITPAGAEPHDYEPTPQDIIKAYSAKVLVMNGGGVDTWAEKIESDLKSKGIVVVNMSETIQLSAAPAGEETTLDPHIWMDPVLAEQEVGLIKAALIKADPAHSQDYTQNASNYITQLQALDQQFKTGLANCQLHDIVTSHAAFGYLAREYGLNQIPIAGLSPDAEPSAQQLADIASEAKQKNIKYIFFESLVSPKLSQTIATEVGAKTIAFNPLEGLTDQEITFGKTYLSVMQDNLSALRIALQCQ